MAYSNGNSFSNGPSMGLDGGTERECPFIARLLQAADTRP